VFKALVLHARKKSFLPTFMLAVSSVTLVYWHTDILLLTHKVTVYKTGCLIMISSLVVHKSLFSDNDVLTVLLSSSIF
jgi:hypothetical protein